MSTSSPTPRSTFGIPLSYPFDSGLFSLVPLGVEAQGASVLNDRAGEFSGTPAFNLERDHRAPPEIAARDELRTTRR